MPSGPRSTSSTRLPVPPPTWSACNPVATIPVKGPSDALGAIDDSTHTLYASDPSDGSVSIINTANCNASITAGCRGPYPTILIGPVAGSPVVNPGTATLYVPTANFSTRWQW